MPSSSGIIRHARRPCGWIAPGPAPAAPVEQRDAWPQAGEDLCYLTGEWRILQRVGGHRWSLDDLVTAWVAATERRAAPPDRILDLGSGIGAVLLMLAWRLPRARLVGIEAQAVSLDLARRSLLWNGAADRCEMRLGDFRDPATLPERRAFELITGTPPYLPRGTATESPRIQWGPCHIEHRGGIEAYCHAAAGALAPHGWFVSCAGGGQGARVETAATAAALMITRRVDVIPRAGKNVLFSVYVMRPPGAGERLHVEPPLIVRDAAGQRTDRFRALRSQMGMPP